MPLLLPKKLRHRISKCLAEKGISTCSAQTEVPVSGWQHSHYHKEITETYIVQHRGIVYAGLKAAASCH